MSLTIATLPIISSYSVVKQMVADDDGPIFKIFWITENQVFQIKQYLIQITSNKINFKLKKNWGLSFKANLQIYFAQFERNVFSQ